MSVNFTKLVKKLYQYEMIVISLQYLSKYVEYLKHKLKKHEIDTDMKHQTQNNTNSKATGTKESRYHAIYCHILDKAGLV